MTSTTGGEGFDNSDDEDDFDDPEETLVADRLNRKKSALSRLGGTSTTGKLDCAVVKLILPRQPNTISQTAFPCNFNRIIGNQKSHYEQSVFVL